MAAEDPAGVREPVREVGGRRVEENPRRLERGGAQHDDLPEELQILPRPTVDDAHARDAAAGRVPDHAVHDAVRAQRHPAGGLGGGERGVERTEVALRDAAAVAGAAVVAGAPSLVVAGEDGRAPDRHHPGVAEVARDRLLHRVLDAGHLHGRQQDAVRQLGEPLRLAADADELLDVRVPRGEVRVADRPVDPDPVARVGLEIEIAEAIRLPRPHDRAPADLSPPDPQEGLLVGRRVRVLDVVDEELPAHLVAGVALALHGLLGRERLAVVPAPVRHAVRRHVFGVVPFRDDHGPRLEHQRAEAEFGEFLRGPAAGDPRADDDRVPDLLPAAHGCPPGRPSPVPYWSRRTHPSKAPGMIR